MNEANEATTAGGTGPASVPDNVRLVASRFFFEYDEKYGEFRKRIHTRNPRYGELKGLVDDPAVTPPGEREHHGRILEACDVYDVNFYPKGHSVVTVCGGYNGGGSDYKWCEYLGEISGAVQRLTDRFGFSWLVDLHEHSDVWYAEIGFTDRREMPAGGWGGCDHNPIAAEDFVRYDKYRREAVANKLPFGLVDWGNRSYSWAWDRLDGTYPFPWTAFHGSLIRPERIANRYAAYDADAGRFREAWGVYEARRTQAFFAVSAAGGLADLERLGKDGLRRLADVPKASMPLLEDWRPVPKAKDSTAG